MIQLMNTKCIVAMSLKHLFYQNDMVKADDVFTSGTLIPVTQNSTYVNFEFYCTTNPRVLNSY